MQATMMIDDGHVDCSEGEREKRIVSALRKKAQALTVREEESQTDAAAAASSKKNKYANDDQDKEEQAAAAMITTIDSWQADQVTIAWLLRHPGKIVSGDGDPLVDLGTFPLH